VRFRRLVASARQRFSDLCACRAHGIGIACAHGGIKTGKNGIAVYYPFALVALKEFAKSDDYEDTGDLLLIFQDEDGAQVTLKVRDSAVSELVERLSRPPSV